MEIKKNMDKLMKRVVISEEMHRNIMAGGKPRKRFSVRKAVLPFAAAALLLNVTYVGAGYVMEHTPLRELFMEKEESPLDVPEEQIQQEIYEDIVHSNIPVVETVDVSNGKTESDIEKESVALGIYGEIIIDNELFSVELLEQTCAGKELSVTYILTDKTKQELMVHSFVDTAFDACSYESGFGDEFTQRNLPADCEYTLQENQRLCTFTQLGKEEYRSGMYNFYVEYFIIPENKTAIEGEEHIYVEAPIEIIGNDKYGLALNGDLDKVEGQVHFDTYDIYISPLNVYLTMDGTYEGDITSDWGFRNYHDITIGFADGTEASSRVMLSSMGYGSGMLDVGMRASFDAAINPDNIVEVLLDDTVIFQE